MNSTNVPQLAKDNASTFNDVARLVLVQRAVCVGLIGGLALSWKMWMGERSFPHLPVFEGLPPFGSPFDTICAGALLALLVSIILRPGARGITVVFLLLSLVQLLQDQVRWQPWYYQYFLMLIPFCLFTREQTRRSPEAILELQRLIVFAVYFWGGAHKFNPGFIALYNDYLMAPLLKGLSGAPRYAIELFGYLIPPIEVAIAFGLCFRKTRNAAALGACAMHAYILATLGPLGRNANTAIWPWNLCMIVIVIGLFFRKPEMRWGLGATRVKVVGAGLTLLTLIMPATYYFGLWDRYLSFHLYSGTQRRLAILVKPSATDKLDPRVLTYLTDSEQTRGYKVLDATRWAMGELNVPFPTERRLMLRIRQSVCQRGFGDQEVFFFMDYPLLPEQRQELHECQP